MVCIIWCFLAVLWFMVLSDGWDVVLYQDFTSSVLTQLYLVAWLWVGVVSFTTLNAFYMHLLCN